MNITKQTMRTALTMGAIAGAAAGLNLGVLALTDVDDPQQSEVASGKVPDGLPYQVVVEVPVIVPDSVTNTPAAHAPIEQAFAGVAEQPVAAPAATTAPPTTAAADTTKTAATKTPRTTTLAPTTTAAPSTAASTTPVPTTVARTTTTSGPATEYLYYDFSGVAAQIIVAQHGDGSLEFWSVSTEEGWNYLVEKDSGSQVELKFSRAPNGEGEAKWKLSVEGGELRVKKER